MGVNGEVILHHFAFWVPVRYQGASDLRLCITTGWSQKPCVCMFAQGQGPRTEDQGKALRYWLLSSRYEETSQLGRKAGRTPEDGRHLEPRGGRSQEAQGHWKDTGRVGIGRCPKDLGAGRLQVAWPVRLPAAGVDGDALL